jgi:AcrR family transcriptional regulator
MQFAKGELFRMELERQIERPGLAPRHLEKFLAPRRVSGKLVIDYLLQAPAMNEHPKHLPADERRAATVEAVISLAAEQNPSDITTTAIAQRMGLTQGALFRHFPTKDAILEAVMNWVAERLLARVDAAAQGSASPLAALEAVFMAHIRFVAEHPGVPRLIFGELQRPGDTLPKKLVQALLQRYGERLRRLLKAGKVQGELDAQLDIDAASASFIGAIQGLVMQSLITGGPARMRRDSAGVFHIFRRGIGSAS